MAKGFNGLYHVRIADLLKSNSEYPLHIEAILQKNYISIPYVLLILNSIGI
jgi:hypothetical protein